MILFYKGNDNFQIEGYDYVLIGDEQMDCLMKDLLIQEYEAKTWTRPAFIYMSSEENVDFGFVRQAVETNINREWTLKRLMDEIDQEFEYFSVRNELYECLMRPDMNRLKEDNEYKRLMVHCFQLYEDKKTPLSVLKEALRYIREYL